MRVVIPFFDGNKAVAVKLLRWIQHLDGVLDYQAVLLHHSGCDPSDCVSAADGLFSKVIISPYEVYGPLQWPHGKNAAWQTYARGAVKDKEPWLFLEPDAIPLHKGWLQRIEKLHQNGNRPFSGFIIQALNQLDSVAVYPHNASELSTMTMLCRAAPFNQAAGAVFAANATPLNGAIAYLHDVDGQSPTFKDKADVDRMIPQGASLFHRCKDGSLIDALSGGTFKAMVAKIASMIPSVKPGEGVEPTATGIDTCVIELGRYGDIINILPVVRDMGPKVALMVAEQFKDVLDGVSYCHKEIFDGGFTDIGRAVEIAKSKYKRVIVAQVSAMAVGTSTKCDAFNVESWRQAGSLHQWGKLKLVFDQRDEAREKRLRKRYLKSGKKRLLVATGGFSSPYPYKDALKNALKKRFSDTHHIIDMDEIKAERIYDLLGLFDAGDVLVTTDSAPLHLAAASEIPVVALISDHPTLWHGTRPQCNCTASFRYWESNERMDAVMDAVAKAAPRTRFFHVWNHYPVKDPETARRQGVARMTWKELEKSGIWVEVATEDAVLPRLFDDGKRKLVYIRDLIDHGCRNAKPHDVVVMTNSDICISSTAIQRLQERMQDVDVCYAFRRDFPRIDRPLNDAEIRNGALYSGTDLFAFRVSWWKTHGDEFPDMLIGTEFWDWVMRQVIDRSEPGKSVSFIDMIYHERHETFWENPANRGTSASQLHNRTLTLQFREKHGIVGDYCGRTFKA